MTTPPTVILFDPLHDDLVATVLNEAWANQVSVFKIVDHRIESEVKKAALGGRNGGAGSTVEILSPELIDPEVDTGHLAFVRLTCIVKDWDTIAQGAHGTKLTGQVIAQYLIQTFWDMAFLGITTSFYPEADCFSALPNPDSAFKLFQVRLRAQLDLGIFPRTSMPAWQDNSDGTVTLIDKQPGGGSAIYYTLDGSLPCPSNLSSATPPGTAVLYTAPIAASNGARLRFKAYAPAANGVTPLGSVVNSIKVSPGVDSPILSDDGSGILNWLWGGAAPDHWNVTSSDNGGSTWTFFGQTNGAETSAPNAGAGILCQVQGFDASGTATTSASNTVTGT